MSRVHTAAASPYRERFARVIASVVTRTDDDRRGGGMYFLVVMVLQVVLGILASLVTAWFSRHREFRADAGGAHLAGRERMLGALRRLAANRELVDTSHQALATMKINDLPAFHRFYRSTEDFEAMIRRQFDTLYRESAESGRVMAIALHPFVIGMPHRIWALESGLDYIAAHDGVWFATGEEIIDAWLKSGATF